MVGKTDVVGNTNMFDGGDSVGGWDWVGDSNWLGNSIWGWYIIWLRDMLGDKGGDFLGLVDGLGDSDIIGPLNNVQFWDNLGDLGSVFNNGAAKSLDFEGLNVLWSNSSIGDGCGDVEVDVGVYSSNPGNCTSGVHSWGNSVSNTNEARVNSMSYPHKTWGRGCQGRCCES